MKGLKVLPMLAVCLVSAPAFAGAPVITSSATVSGATANSATLTGQINPAGLATTVWFQYGLTTNYGSISAAANVPAAFYPPSPSAITFNGSNQNGTVSGFGTYAPTNEITVEFWQFAYAAAMQSTLILNPDNGSDRINAHVPWVDGNIYWDFGDVAAGGYVGAGRLVLSGQNVLGAWTHVAMVSSAASNGMFVYINGQLAAQSASPSFFTQYQADLLLGGGANNFYFNGALAEFRVWNQALNQTTIQSWMDRTLEATHPAWTNLVAYWPMNEGSGDTLNDDSGHGRSAALANSPAWQVVNYPPAGATLTGLFTNTTYHFQMVASNSAGVSFGADQTLTTLAAPHIQTIYSFNSGPYAVYGGVAVGPDGNWYGTSEEGGSANAGTLFRMTTNGLVTVLADFNGTNGANPYAGLTLGPDGNFYGTVAYGGASNYGTVFQLTTNGTVTTLVNFTGENGADPYGGLTLEPDGKFYGTTDLGGSGNLGTIFRMDTNGNLVTLASFNGTNGSWPDSDLTLGPDGNFYGTTYYGGSNDSGAVFQFNTNGALTTLASFNGANGSEPYGSLTLGPDGNFYGTTDGGGVDYQGTIFRVNLGPSIINQPVSQAVASGNSASFSITVFGTAPYAYEWFFNGAALPGATNGMLTLAPATPSAAGNYQVVISNTWGTATSSVVTLMVTSSPLAPAITAGPTSESVPIGGTAGFAVSATGGPPLVYRWYFDSVPMAGAASPQLSFGPVMTNQAGGYQVIVTNDYGSATSAVATLNVLLQPNPYGISNRADGSKTLYLASIPGSTNHLWATTNLTLPLAQWQVIATNIAPASGFFQFTDTNTSGLKARFYRLSTP
jgi:uncharacterized repeat protein (TIGR03803 family)